MDLQLNFIGPINDQSTSNLCDYIFSQTEKIEHLVINISSTGGALTPAIAMYNYLKSLPFEITMRNIGEISSAAVLPYLAGKTRLADPSSRFTIHPIRTGGENMSYYQVEEMLSSLAADIENFSYIVNTETNSLNGLANVDECLKFRAIVFRPEIAYKCGITTQPAT